MNRKAPISTIMTQNVLTIKKDSGLKTALDIIKKHHVRHLPVVDENSVVGIISSSDLNRLTFSNLFEDESGQDEAILEMLSIDQVMSEKPTIVSSETSIEEVGSIFINQSFHSLPVVENGKLVGIVTTTDVIKYCLKNA